MESQNKYNDHPQLARPRILVKNDFVFVDSQKHNATIKTP